MWTRYKSLSKKQKITLWVPVILAVYTVTGFFLLPLVLQRVSVDKLSTSLGRDVAIEKVTFNPYTLLLTMEAFTIQRKNADEALLSFQNARVNFQAVSILKTAPVIKELTIDRLLVNTVRNRDKTYNFSDLIPGGPPGTPPDKKKEAHSPLRFSVSNIVLNNGKILIHDKLKNKKHALTNLSVALPFLSNMDSHVDVYVTPHFSVNFNGSPIVLKGKSKPFADSRTTDMELDLKEVHLHRYADYIPFKTGLDLKNALMDLSCTVAFNRQKQPGSRSNVLLSGKLRLSDIEMTDFKAVPLFEMNELAVSMAESEVLKGDINLEEILLSGPAIFLSFDSSRELNVQAVVSELTGKPDKKTGTTEAAAPKKAAWPFVITCTKAGVDNLSVTLQERTSSARDVFSLGHFGIDNLELDSRKKRIHVDRIAGGKGDLNIYRLSDSEINLKALLPGNKTKTEDKGVTEKDSRWHVKMGDTILRDFSATGEDLVKKGKGEILIQNIDLETKGLSTLPDEKAGSTLSFRVNDKGLVTTSGKLGINPLSLRFALSAEQIDLSRYQPFVSEHLNLIVSGGDFYTSGKLAIQKKDEKDVTISYTGDMTVTDFASVTQQNSQEFLQFKSLDLNRLTLDLFPFSARMDLLSLKEPVLNFAVYENGASNITRIAASAENDPPPPDKKREKENTAIPLRIERLALEKGQILINDRSVSPHFKTSLSQTDMTATGLSPGETIESDIDISTMINGHTPLAITGKINPLKKDFFCDITAALSDMDLGYLSPYSGKYAGYKIQKGKLTLDLSYLIEKRKLDSENDFYLDQFEFGEKVDSEDAVNAPVKLAVALLKDPMGRISLHFPVKGDLDDPKFSVFGVIIKMVMNLFAKAATAPFSLLGSMFGAEEDLNIITFKPGSADITAAGHKKIHTLVKALSQRPGLNLEITGYTNIAADREALIQAGFDRKLKARKLLALVSQGNPGVPVDDITLTEQEYDKYLRQVFSKTEAGSVFTDRMAEQRKPAETADGSDADKNKKNGAQKEVPDVFGEITEEQMIRAVKKEITVTDDDLEHLADDRARAVKGTILESGGIDPARIFITEGSTLEYLKNGDPMETGSVILSLK